jgi:hypothetical protein
VGCSLWHGFFNLGFLNNKTNVMQRPFNYLKSALLLVLSFTAFLYSYAQDKSVDVNISTDKGGGGFMGSPWMWVVGAAIFILLLVALLRGRGKND